MACVCWVEMAGVWGVWLLTMHVREVGEGELSNLCYPQMCRVLLSVCVCVGGGGVVKL